MADINKFSEQVVDLAERLANVSDAAKGRDKRSGMLRARWLLLPAAGAGLYGLTTSRAFTRQAKSVVGEAKEKASELPEELVGRVHEVTGSSANGRRSRAKSMRATQSSGQGRRKAKSTS